MFGNFSCRLMQPISVRCETDDLDRAEPLGCIRSRITQWCKPACCHQNLNIMLGKAQQLRRGRNVQPRWQMSCRPTQNSSYRWFSSLIQAAYENFFVDCSVEPVADYRAFVEKSDQLERITEMGAKVHPPNPLFGHLWGDLKNYIAHRNAE